MNLSTYNNFKNNTQRDAVIISICNSLTSIYAGFVVFAILGFMKDQSGADEWADVSLICDYLHRGIFINTPVFCIRNVLVILNYIS